MRKSIVLVQATLAANLLAVPAATLAANATVSQQQVNLRVYTAEYDVAAQKYTYDGVSSTPGPTAQHASANSEFSLRFGGTCAPNTSLKRSVVTIYGANQPHYHQWAGTNNLNEITKQLGVNVTGNAMLADACNAELARKIKAGATYQQLKSASFQVWQAPWGQVRHELECSDNSTNRRNAPLKADVVCGPADVRAVKRKERKNAKILEAAATLTGAEMGMKTNNCPVNAALRVYVRTDVPTVVEYQIVTPTGQRSSRRTLPVSLDQGNWIEGSAVINFSIPQTAASSASGGLPGGASAGSPSSVSIGSSSPGGSSGGGSNSSQAAGSTLSQLTPANLHSNAFRIEILKPQSYLSNSVSYSVECLPTAVGHGRGQLTAKPRSTHSQPATLNSSAAPSKTTTAPHKIAPLGR